MASHPPIRLVGAGTILRRLQPEDAEAFHEAIVASADHLRPWMPWAADEPRPIAARRELIDAWGEEFDAGTSFAYGIFAVDHEAFPDEPSREGSLIGSCGLHRRGRPDELEIGYWIDVRHTGRGHITEAAALLTDAAFAMDGIELVTIHMDKANLRSGAVPGRLGFRFAGEAPDQVEAPGETGVDLTWAIDRASWAVAG